MENLNYLNMKSFDEFVNEKFKYETSMINGKKVSSTFQGSTSNMNEFIKHIKDLPKTLKSIKIPPVGGDTCFSNMELAWETLDKNIKDKITL